MINTRLEKLKIFMIEENLDGILLTGDPNRNYISYFTGDESYTLISKNKDIFITDSRYIEQARDQVEGFEIYQYSTPFTKDLAKLIVKNNITKLGFEENILTFSKYDEFAKNLNCELIPLNGLVEKMRIIKDDFEIKKISKAASIADDAFEKIVKFIKPGMTEKEVSLQLEYDMKKLGAQGVSFKSIVASGKRSSLPHGIASDKIIENGDFITLDFGCIYDEYCSDMTRTIVVGEASEKMLDIYNTVKEAQAQALKYIKEGVKASEVDKIARDYIKSKGYGDYFGHGLGHGVGLEIHEAPAVNSRNHIVLKEGMIITDEPGIYIPDFGGVRIEDLILVKKDGCEVLSKSSKELICI
ncbi:M24 family metallopeptidase [Clostridium sp. DL1XJH146]